MHQSLKLMQNTALSRGYCVRTVFVFNIDNKMTVKYGRSGFLYRIPFSALIRSILSISRLQNPTPETTYTLEMSQFSAFLRSI